MKKIIALCMVLALALTMLASCGGGKSKLIATYDGVKSIYEDDADFSDLYNLTTYHHTLENEKTSISTSEYNAILSEAVKSTIMLRLLEEEMAARGYSVDMEAVNQKAAEDEAIYNKLYEGGFEAFCREWNLSENVFVTYNKYHALRELAQKFVTFEGVTEQEAQKYYDDNTSKYFKVPHYDVHTLYLQVTNPEDANEKKSVYDDAMIYIGMLNSGKSWETVKETAFYKYNAEHGMPFSEYLSGMQCVSKEYFLEVEDLELTINNLDKDFKEKNGKTFEEMFPGGFEAYAKENNLIKQTKKYNEALKIYMNYSSERYLAEFRYAITTQWEIGKTYATPIYHASYDSYVVLTFTRIENMDGIVTFDEAKEEIYGILEAEKKEKAVEDYLSQKLSDLRVQIQYK